MFQLMFEIEGLLLVGMKCILGLETEQVLTMQGSNVAIIANQSLLIS